MRVVLASHTQTKLSEENLYKSVSCSLMFSRIGKKCTKELTPALDSLTHFKKNQKISQKPSKKPQPKPRKKNIYHGTQNNCLSVCLSRIFTETSLSSRLVAVCFMQYPIKCFSSCFFLSCCTPSMKSLFQLPAPLELIEAGCPSRSISVHQSDSGKCGRFFCSQLLMPSISQTTLQQPVP